MKNKSKKKCRYYPSKRRIQNKNAFCLRGGNTNKRRKKCIKNYITSKLNFFQTLTYARFDINTFKLSTRCAC